MAQVLLPPARRVVNTMQDLLPPARRVVNAMHDVLPPARRVVNAMQDLLLSARRVKRGTLTVLLPPVLPVQYSTPCKTCALHYTAYTEQCALISPL